MPCMVYETPEELAASAQRQEDALTGPLHQQIQTLTQSLAERDAMLCAVLTVFEYPAFYDHQGTPIGIDALTCNVNWTEAGITEESMIAWWREHQRLDALRIAREFEKTHTQRTALLARMTPDERVLLGFPR